MNFATGIRLAVQTLTHHKVRCALSMLGICIGGEPSSAAWRSGEGPRPRSMSKSGT